MGGISVWQLLIIAVIVILLFGTKKLRNLGVDLGSSIKGFKKAITDVDVVEEMELKGKVNLNEDSVKKYKSN